MKPKLNEKGIPAKDQCQTPDYALTPLLDYLPKDWVVWEPCAGEGYLVRALVDAGYTVVDTDILRGQDFYQYQHPPPHVHCWVTNLPFSHKYDMMDHGLSLGIPWAALIPGESLFTKWCQINMEKHNLEAITFYPRVDFKMPNAGWAGGGAQFPTFWLTYKLNIGRRLTLWGKLKKWSPEKKRQMDLTL